MTVREVDTITRPGGDEFAIAQSGARQPATAEALAQRLLDAIGLPYEIDEHHVAVGVSIGITGDFIRCAEETGLIVPIGALVLRMALSDAACWPIGVRVAVNLSPRQMMQDDMADVDRGSTRRFWPDRRTART